VLKFPRAVCIVFTDFLAEIAQTTPEPPDRGTGVKGPYYSVKGPLKGFIGSIRWRVKKGPD